MPKEVKIKSDNAFVLLFAFLLLNYFIAYQLSYRWLYFVISTLIIVSTYITFRARISLNEKSMTISYLAPFRKDVTFELSDITRVSKLYKDFLNYDIHIMINNKHLYRFTPIGVHVGDLLNKLKARGVEIL